MSKREYQNISEFINGTLSEDSRECISKQIKSHTTNVESKKMKTDNKQVFDRDKAWKKFRNTIEADDLLLSKSKKMFSIRNIAASIILLIGLSVTAYVLFNNYSQTQFTEISSANSIKEISLPDGSQITLNKNATIKFPKEFSDNNRTVEFSGEAFFDIAKNPAKPFIIKANKAEVVVLGTSFNVFADEKDNITVTVKTGKVKLSKNETENIILNPEEVGKIKNNTLSKYDNIDKNYLAWKTKCFEYNGELLSKVIKDFNKVYQVNIILEDKEIGNLPIVSSPQNKTLDVALSLICTSGNLKYKQKADTIIISRK